MSMKMTPCKGCDWPTPVGADLADELAEVYSGRVVVLCRKCFVERLEVANAVAVRLTHDGVNGLAFGETVQSGEGHLIGVAAVVPRVDDEEAAPEGVSHAG